MNRRVLSIMMCLMALTNHIWAADKLTIRDLLITPGVNNKEFSIELNNDIAYAAFQFDLYLPDGMTITKFSAEESRFPEGTTLQMKKQNDGSYRFIAVANKIWYNIIDNKGSIIKINVSANNATATGNLTGYFRNIKLSKGNGEGNSYSEMTFPITVVAPSIVTVQNYTREYGEANPTFVHTVTGGSLFGAPVIECEATATSPVGTYDILVKQGSVRNDVVEYRKGTLTITKAPLNIAVGNYTKKQGDAMPTFTPTYTGFKNNENKNVLTKLPDVQCNANETSEPGNYPITLSGAEARNYDIRYTNGTLTVTEADLVTITANNYSRVYGEKNPVFAFTTEGAELSGTPELSCTATETSPVGTYDILVKKGTVDNYNVKYEKGTLTITKAPLNIAAGTYTKKQGEAMPVFTPSYTGFKNGENKDVLTKQPEVACNANEGSEPGEYAVTVSGAEASNYDISYTNGKLIVSEADAITIIAQNYERKYGEKNPTFEYTVETKEGAVLEGIPEITCEAKPNSPVGTYEIRVEQGTVKNYNVTYVAGTLTIKKAPLTIGVGDYIKEQGDPMPEYELTYTGFRNNEDKGVLSKQPVISCNATEATAPGEYPITLSGAEAQNYDIAYVNGKLVVTDAPPVTITANSYTREYGEENPVFAFTSEGAPLDGSPEIVCEATATSPVGTYDILVKKGSLKNYNVTYITGTLTITKAPLTIAAGSPSKQQGDAMPELTVTYTGFKNGENKDVLTKQPTILCNADEDSEPGEYPIMVSGAEARNYSISYTNGKLVVTEADPIVVTAKSYTRKYGDANPVWEFTTKGGKLKGEPQITCTATETSPVGTYNIMVEPGTVRSYNVTYVAGTLTIEKAPLTIAANDYSKKQGEPMPDFELTYTGFKNNETKEVLTQQPIAQCNANEATAPGEYPITVSGAEANNYNISYTNGTLTVTEADLVTIMANSYSRVYGEKNPVFDFTTEGAELSGTPELTCTATETSPVGTYDILVKKGTVGNYNVKYEKGTLTITKAPLNIAAGTYTKKQGEAMPVFTPSYTGFKNSDNKDVLTKQPTITCEADATSNPGEYPVTVSGAEAQNYDISYTNGTLTVTQADLVTITAKSYTREYGSNNPVFEFTTEGAPLEGTPEIVCEATATSPVGTYDILVKQGTVKNYNVTYVAGTLTITKAPLKIAVGTYTKKQGDSLPLMAPTYTGFKNNETEEVLTKQPVVTCQANEASEPGEYPVTVSGAEAQNYDISYTNGKLVVAEADAVIIIAKNYTRYYGDSNPNFEYSVEGATLDGEPALTCMATATSPVGTYEITVAKGTVKNYNVTYVAGTLTIEKAPLTIAMGEYTKKQGEAMPNFEPTYTGFKNNETKEVLTQQATVNCNATEATAPGEYPITVAGAEAQNYAISYTNGKLTVTEADLVTITAKSYTRQYGDENSVFEYTTEGAPLEGTPEVVCNATATSPIGTYDIIVKQGTVKNYNVAYVAGTLTITKAPLKIAVGTYTKKQGDAMPELTPTYDGFKNGETKDVLTKQPIVVCEADEASEPGEYPITVAGAEARNYDISYTNGKLVVAEADAVIIMANSYTRYYGDNNPRFEYTVEGAALDGEPEITCEASATSPVGTYDIIVKRGSMKNYNVTYVAGTLTIEKVSLNISVGTYMKKQGEAMPNYKLNYTGFRNNDTEEDLTTQPTVNCEANEISAPGEYLITLSGAEAQNYDISYTNGKLIVVKADAVIIKAKSYTRQYGDANPVFEFTTEGAPLDGTPEIVCEATETSPIGTYNIQVKPGSVKNFNVIYVAGTLTIEKAPLTIEVGTYVKKQGEPMPTFTLNYTGFKNNETEEILTTLPTVHCEADEASALGEYTITVEGATADNYDISCWNGKLVVIKADKVIIIAKSYTREYGDENPVFEYTTEGAALEGTPEIYCPAKSTTPVGSYIILLREGTVKNYNVTYIAGSITIKKAPLTVSVGNYTREQGQENPAFELKYFGWKNGENEDVLITKPTVSTIATPSSPTGDYLINVSGGEAENYEFNYSNGVLTITPATNIAAPMMDHKPMKIYSATGKLLNTTSVKQLPRGLYIVGGKKIVVK